MYNTKLIIDYHLNEINSDSEISNEKYQSQILQLFELEDFNETDINKKLSIIFNSIKKEKNFNKIETICNHLCENWGSKETELGFVCLFSYDYLPFIHPIICEYLEKQIISENALNVLNSKVFN